MLGPPVGAASSGCRTPAGCAGLSPRSPPRTSRGKRLGKAGRGHRLGSGRPRGWWSGQSLPFGILGDLVGDSDIEDKGGPWCSGPLSQDPRLSGPTKAWESAP